MGKELELAIKIGGKIDKSLGSAVSSAQSQLNSIASGVNKAMTAVSAATVAAGAALIKDSIETYQSYESAIASAAAAGGIKKGTAEYELLDAAASEAGRTTVKTAEESANALEYMMLAGWSANDAAEALLPVLKLSAATEEDLATTSDLVTDSMSAMGLGIEDLTHYLDVCAAASTETNQTATHLQEAYIGVGSVLNTLNVPVEESAALLGVLADQGTKGSEAGTKLNSILARMQKTSGEAHKGMEELGLSLFDAEGNTRDLLEVFQEMYDKTKVMTEEDRSRIFNLIGGTQNAAELTKIMQGFATDAEDATAQVYELTETFEDCGGALDDLYGTKTDTLEGSIALLSSAWDDMKRNIGETVSPVMREAVDNFTAKIPEIQEIIISTIEKITPYIESFINYVIDNIDDIISKAITLTEVFAAFKIGTGVLKTVTTFSTLATNLTAISKAKGAGTVVKGVVGTFTGAGSSMSAIKAAKTATTAAKAGSTAAKAATTAGTAAAKAGTTAAAEATKAAAATTTATNSAAAGFASAAGPLLLLAGTFAAMTYGIDKWEKSAWEYHYADGLEEQTEKVTEAADAVVKYNDLASEIDALQLTINSSESTDEEIESARERLQEIADLVNDEYNLYVSADTSELDDAIEKITAIERGNLASESADVVNQISSATGEDGYEESAKKAADLEQQISQTAAEMEAFGNIYSSASLLQTQYSNGLIDEAEYLAALDREFQTAKKNGYDGGGAAQITSSNANKFVNDMENKATQQPAIDRLQEQLNEAQSAMNELETSARDAGTSYAEVLASDINYGNASGIQTDIDLFNNLGTAMQTAGMDTTELGAQMTAAAFGFTDFSEALQSATDSGQLDDFVLNFMNFESTIGASSSEVIGGAALIANGFTTVEEAATAGGDALNGVLASIQSYGDMNGLFEGMDTSEIAGKITEISQEIGLIPDDKSITFNAEGNLEVVDTIQKIVTTEDGTFGITFEGKTVNLDEIMTAVEIQDELTDTETAQTVTGTFDGEDAIATALDYQSKLKDTEVTYTVNYKTTGTPASGTASVDGSHAGGLDYVPWDGYIAELHEGERVLTSDEAAEYRATNIGTVLMLLKEMTSARSSQTASHSGASGGGTSTVTFAPNITIAGNANREDVTQAVASTYEQFKEWYEDLQRDERRTKF